MLWIDMNSIFAIQIMFYSIYVGSGRGSVINIIHVHIGFEIQLLQVFIKWSNLLPF